MPKIPELDILFARAENIQIDAVHYRSHAFGGNPIEITQACAVWVELTIRCAGIWMSMRSIQLTNLTSGGYRAGTDEQAIHR